jgi:nucleoside-diphosphate-sugar epimerase
MPPRRAFLTGATGFLGGHVARALIDEGWRVTALVRSDPQASPLLAGRAIDFVRGDLSREADLPAGLRGCDAIVHVAGLVKARTLEDYREVNLRGTERLARAAARVAPGANFVLVSSQAAAGPARGGVPVRASDPARPVSWYGTSKLEGEQAVRRIWPGRWTVLRPGVVYGPADRGLLTYFRLAVRGILPLPAPGRRIQIGESSRIARAIAVAAAREDLGGTTAFLCDPQPVTLRDLAEALARVSGRRVRIVAVPDAAVRMLGAVETLREAVTRRSRPFNADKAREILAGEWVCEAGLEAELGMPEPIPLEEGLRRAWDWYREAGWLAL